VSIPVRGFNDLTTQPQQSTQHRPVRVVINQAAFAHNLARVKALTPNSKVMAVIKADGYGHGIEIAAQGLQAADEFAVNSLDDVSRLRRAGVSKKLNLLSAVFDVEQLNSMAAQNVQPVIYEWNQLKMLEQLDPDANLSVWIKADTGMGRLGFLVNEMPAVMRRVTNCSGLADYSLMSHLGYADNPSHPINAQQISLFEQLLSDYDFTASSLLNSAGVVGLSDAAYDSVRPGVMLYGISPQIGISAAELDLKPVMTFKSELISVKNIPSGSTIGYSGTYTLDSDSKVGFVACGYGDGYPRHAPTGTPMLVNGMLVPLIGRVSMDILAVDLGELPAEIGDEVILWGADNPIEEVAQMAGTIAYELCCGILPRVERVLV